MNALTGLPRSGSTLLCNILNQNPRFHASSTSPLPVLFANLISTWSAQIEVKGDLQRDRKGTEEKLARAARGLCDAWHKRTDKRSIIFDKSRVWIHHIPALRQAYPKSKVIVLIRDLRDVFASIEKQHLKNPILDEAATPGLKTQFGRADHFFSPKEIIGASLNGIKDMLDRKLEVFVLKYEDLAAQPEAAMKAIYKYLDEKPFQHKFKQVKGTATDPDGFYLYKYPHEGIGDVKPSEAEGWRQHVSQDTAQAIVTRFPWFYMAFEYPQACAEETDD